LVSGGPGLVELGWGEVAVGAVGSVHVVVDAPLLDEDLGFEEPVELPAVEELVVDEEGSDRVGLVWDAADALASVRLVIVEARAALASAARGGRLTTRCAKPPAATTCTSPTHCSTDRDTAIDELPTQKT
jgi:hypothetical protein